MAEFGSDGNERLVDDGDRFLVDATCGTLATYLRMCGYDAAYALDRGVEHDDARLELARAEDRQILTRDAHLTTRAGSAIELTGRDVRDQLGSLADAGVRLELPDEPRRCSACNGELEALSTVRRRQRTRPIRPRRRSGAASSATGASVGEPLGRRRRNARCGVSRVAFRPSAPAPRLQNDLISASPYPEAMTLSAEARERLTDVVELQPTKNATLQERWDMDSGSEVHRYLEDELKEYYYRDDDSKIRATPEAVSLVGGDPAGEVVHVTSLQADAIDVIAGPDEVSQSVVSVLHDFRAAGRDPPVDDVRVALGSLADKGVLERIQRAVPTYRLSIPADELDVRQVDGERESLEA